MKLVIVSGRSGSGKSTALHMLEDIGFYCVDNLPAELMPEFSRHALLNSANTEISSANPNIAIGIDARNIATDLSRFPSLLKEISREIDINVVYLDATDDILIKRFSETRRKHPLTNEDVSLTEALREESTRLDSIAAMADLSIDTSSMNLHQLREFVRERIGRKTEATLSVLFQSFGFKSNIPIDSDLVFDVRCLPNPYWELSLRELTGKDDGIQTFLASHDDVQQMITDIKTYLCNWLPHFLKSNRSYLTVSIGCTGGKHRSVYVAESLYAFFQKEHEIDIENAYFQVRHREL